MCCTPARRWPPAHETQCHLLCSMELFVWVLLPFFCGDEVDDRRPTNLDRPELRAPKNRGKNKKRNRHSMPRFLYTTLRCVPLTHVHISSSGAGRKQGRGRQEVGQHSQCYSLLRRRSIKGCQVSCPRLLWQACFIRATVRVACVTQAFFAFVCRGRACYCQQVSSPVGLYACVRLTKFEALMGLQQ